MDVLMGNMLLAGLAMGLYFALARAIHYFERQGRRLP